MSFGFGVGDFLAVGKLVWDVYRAYADAPEQFRNFSQEILSLHVVLGKVEEQLYNTTTFSRQDTDNLRILYHGLKTTMEALDALLKKYQRLSENRYRSRSFDRLKWGQEDFVGLREKLRSNITLLTAFNSSLANCQLANQSTQLGQQEARLIGIQEELGQLFVAGGLRRRRSVASLPSIASFSLSIGQKEAWKELSRELHRNGITVDMIQAKKEDICKLFQTTSFSGNSEGVLQGPEARQKGKQANKFDQIPCVDGMRKVRTRHDGTRLAEGKNALYTAVTKGQTELIKAPHDKGANIDASSSESNNRTALHSAASDGITELVKLLLDRGASIDARDKKNYTALHLAARRGHSEVVKVLLKRGAIIDAKTKPNKSTALHEAAKLGHIEVVKILLKRGAAIDAADGDKMTGLHYASQRGHVEVVTVLLDRGATIDGMDDTGWTGLHWAARWAHFEVVRVLLERGADIDADDCFGRPPLHYVAKRGYVEVVQLLVEWGANIDATDEEGETALYHATRGCHAQVLEWLLENCVLDIDRTNIAGETVLDIARELGWKQGVKLIKAELMLQLGVLDLY